MQYPAYGALFLAGVVPAMSGLRRGLPVPGLRPSEILIAFCGSAILLAVANRRDRTPWQMFDWVALLYVLATVALGSWDLIDRGDGFGADAIGDLLGPLQFFILYRAVASVLTTSELRIKAIRWILYSSVPVSLLAILQQAGIGSFNSFLTSLTGTAAGSDPTATGLVRATGPFPIWHSLAGYLFLVVMLGLGAYLEGSGRILGTRRLLYVLVPAVGALITTATLAPIFGALAGAALLGRAYGRMGRSILGVALAIFIVGFLFTPALSEPLRAAVRQHGHDPGRERVGSAHSADARCEILDLDRAVRSGHVRPLGHRMGTGGPAEGRLGVDGVAVSDDGRARRHPVALDLSLAGRIDDHTIKEAHAGS